jgi:hypothetical protein
MHYAKERLKRTLTIICRTLIGFWILLALIALIWFLILHNEEPYNEAGLALAHAMLALSFPSGVFGYQILILTGEFLNYIKMGHTTIVSLSYFNIVVTWFIFFIVGCLQWFVLVPWLWRSWKRIKSNEMAIRIGPVFKWCWIAFSLGVLLLALSVYYAHATQYAEMVLFYGILISCFPTIQLLMVVFWLIAFCDVRYVLAILWLFWFIVGFLQWFVLLPWLWRKKTLIKPAFTQLIKLRAK